MKYTVGDEVILETYNGPDLVAGIVERVDDSGRDNLVYFIRTNVRDDTLWVTEEGVHGYADPAREHNEKDDQLDRMEEKIDAIMAFVGLKWPM